MYLKKMIKMKSTFGIIGLFLFFLLSCSSGKYVPNYYSRNSLSLEQLPALYENVPYFQDSTINLFIMDLEKPRLSEEARRMGIVGTVVCHPLIDERGELEAVYIKHPLHPLADEAAIEAIKLSKFRTYVNVTGRNSKYSLVIPIEFLIISEKELDYFFKNKSAEEPDSLDR